MDFTISVQAFQNVIKKMGYIIKSAEDGVTSMLLVEAFTDNKIRFSGTDKDVHMVINTSDCSVSEKGKCLLQLRDINAYVQRFMPLSDGAGTENFRIITNDREGVIKTKTTFPSGKPSYRYLTFKLFETELLQPVKEFQDAQLIINSDIILEGLNKILHCVDPSEIRRALSGLYISIDDNKITFAGTNGVKLSEAQLPIVADIRQSAHILKHSMALAMKLVLDSNAQVFMSFEDRAVYIRCNDIYLVGGLIMNETYPNYREALKNYSNIITMPRYDLIDTISAANSVLDKEDNNRLTMCFNGNKLTLKNDKLEAIHEFDYEFEHTLDVDINGAFLLQILMDFVGPNLEICFIDGLKPIIFRIKDNPDHTALLMPLRRR